jgi:ABC-type antimicrobial peptide transport system permease subunit
MPISYVAKRLMRSWQLYLALLLGALLATTFFAGVNIGADTAAKQALDRSLEQLQVDYYINLYQSLSAQNITTILSQIADIPEITKAEVITKIYTNVQLPAETYQHTFRLVGITPNSQAYQGWTNHPPSIPENHTHVLATSTAAKNIKQGDQIQVNMTMPIYSPEYPMGSTVSYILNLTVDGFAELNDKAIALIQGQYYNYGGIIMGMGSPTVFPTQTYAEDMLIVDWQNTLAGFIDVLRDQPQFYVQTDILMYINRNELISVWDIPGSVTRLENLKNKIENQIGIGGFSFTVQSQLQYTLGFSQIMLMAMRLVFIGVSLPVFFVAWYMGTTVSDVSFNLRRREIGLLLTKGFSRTQLFRMFLIEALLIGVIAGAAGIALSLVLTPTFVNAVGGKFIATPVYGIDTVAMTFIFSIVLVILAVFRPARRASNLSTVEALREYTLVEEVKPYRRRLPWIAFILGAYKLIILALGINLFSEISKLAMSGANFLLVLIAGAWAVVDAMLTPIGSVLFFWGFTKIFIRGSLKFQEITAKAARFLGDLGVLATRNVQRNPARAASVAFLIALIIGYGIQITGTLASDQDYNTRLVYATVGSDIRVDLQPPVNITATTAMAQNIRANVSSIASTTTEYTFYGTSSFETLQLTAINLTDWRDAAYCEPGWFSGNDIDTAFQQLQSDNRSIILDRNLAERSDLHIGEIIRVNFWGDRYATTPIAKDLTIAGFTSNQWSYVSNDLFSNLLLDVKNSSSTRILAKLTSGADGTAAANEIRSLVPPRTTVTSASEQIQQQASDPMYTGTLNLQRLGVAFAILAASVGTALVSLVSLRERQREASMMSVRGLSFKQLTVMLLTESIAVVTFAVLLGSVAGLIIVYGNVASASSAVPSLVTKRLVFPIDTSLTIFAYIGLVFASSILPVIIMSRRYISRLERVVRQA